MEINIKHLINLYYKINKNYHKLFKLINHSNLQNLFEEDFNLLQKKINNINNLIIKYNYGNYEEQNLKEELINLNNFYNNIYNKYICYS